MLSLSFCALKYRDKYLTLKTVRFALAACLCVSYDSQTNREFFQVNQWPHGDIKIKGYDMEAAYYGQQV